MKKEDQTELEKLESLIQQQEEGFNTPNDFDQNPYGIEKEKKKSYIQKENDFLNKSPRPMDGGKQTNSSFTNVL